MVQLRISVSFVALSAFLAVSALPANLAAYPGLQSRQASPLPPPPQARAWGKRQRNRQGPAPGQGQNRGQGQQVPAPQGQIAQPQARPNPNAQANRRPPPQARNLGVVMRSIVGEDEESSTAGVQLRSLQERQRVQPFPEQQDHNPPPPPEPTQQPPPPRTPGRLMRMRERRQAGGQGQNRQPPAQPNQNDPQRQPQNQAPPPVPTPPSPPAVPVPVSDNGNIIPADRQRPRSASRLFGRQGQGGNQPNAIPQPPPAPTTIPPAPRPSPGSNTPVPTLNNGVAPSGQKDAHNNRQQQPSFEVVSNDINDDLEKRDLLEEEYEGEEL
ncbi:hypothetical protein OPQ81_003571 [Rhizoctonia solani]|nr:hypothetical protein OPQ81_003571 [Rhizoctonia solani]